MAKRKQTKPDKRSPLEKKLNVDTDFDAAGYKTRNTVSILIILAAAFAVAYVFLFVTPGKAPAAGLTGGVHNTHGKFHANYGHHHRHGHHSPGYVIINPDDSRYYNSAHAVPVPAVDPIPVVPPYSLRCQRSQEIVTVPAHDGGTAQVRVTRC